MKTHGLVEVQLRAFLTSAVDGGKRVVRFTPYRVRHGEWRLDGPPAPAWALWRREISLPLLGIEPYSLVFLPEALITELTELSRLHNFPKVFSGSFLLDIHSRPSLTTPSSSRRDMVDVWEIWETHTQFKSEIIKGVYVRVDTAQSV